MTTWTYGDAAMASTCIDYGDDCCGLVEFHTVGSAPHAWPRCKYHAQALKKLGEDRRDEIQDRRTRERR